MRYAAPSSLPSLLQISQLHLATHGLATPSETQPWCADLQAETNTANTALSVLQAVKGADGGVGNGVSIDRIIDDA